MAKKPRPLQNFLRTYRRKAGLSQDDVARLLGAEDAANVSRHERGVRIPDTRTILAYEAIYAVTAHRLFPELARAVERGVVLRAKALLVTEDAQPSARDRQRHSHLSSLANLKDQ